jgi:phage gp29-like protein
MDSKNTKALKGKEQGSSGVAFSGGVILSEDYNPKLNGDSANKIYEEMRRGDATVSASLDAIKLPIMGADFTVDAASDDRKDRDVADFVYDELHHSIDWDKFLGEALTFLDFGFALFEMVFESHQMNGRDRIGLAKLGYRKQTTIAAWETADHQPGVTQRSWDGKEASIPEIKLIRFTRKQEGDNYQGISILRAAYRHWYIKDKLYKIDAVGHERQAVGILDVTTPPGATDKDKKKMRQLARNLRANQESYLEHPEGWVVQFLNNQGSSMRDVEPSINHHDRQIMKNVLAQFLEIGSAGSSGTRNVSEDQSRLFELAVQHVAKQIVSQLQNTVVRALVDLNFTNVEYPTLRVSNISDDNIPVISEAIKKFVDAGVIQPRAEDENTVRRMVGWSELTDEEIKKRNEAPAKTITEDAEVKADKIEADAQVSRARNLFAAITRRLHDRSSKAA